MTLHRSEAAPAHALERRIDAEERACLVEFPFYATSIRAAADAVREAVARCCGGPIPDYAELPLQRLAHKLALAPEDLWGMDPQTILTEQEVWTEVLYPLWLIRHRCERRMFAADPRPDPPWYVRALGRRPLKPQ